MSSTLDVTAVRARIPALASGVAFFDGPGGSQVPDVVADAIRDALTAPLSNRGTVTEAERNADAIVGEARTAIADLLGAQSGGVVFGRSMTALTYEMARTLAKAWGPGDEVVVTRLDHDANVRPWVQAAEAVGATVRWAEFDPGTAELTVDDVAAQLSDRTRIVAVTGASNLIGTRPPVGEIAEAVHARGAFLYVDGCTSPRTLLSMSPRSAPISSSARPTSSWGRTAESSPRRRSCWRGSSSTTCSRRPTSVMPPTPMPSWRKEA